MQFYDIVDSGTEISIRKNIFDNKWKNQIILTCYISKIVTETVMRFRTIYFHLDNIVYQLNNKVIIEEDLTKFFMNIEKK